MLAELNGAELQAIRARIGVLFQGAALFDSLTVGENIAFPLREQRARRRSRREIGAEVEDVARRLKVARLLARYPAEISIGEHKRVGLARAIVTRPEVMSTTSPPRARTRC